METKRKALGTGLEQLFNNENINFDGASSFEELESGIIATSTDKDIQNIPINAVRKPQNWPDLQRYLPSLKITPTKR